MTSCWYEALLVAEKRCVEQGHHKDGRSINLVYTEQAYAPAVCDDCLAEVGTINQPEEKGKEFIMDIISEYTVEQAEADGILVDVTRSNPAWKKGLFNYVTVTLLERGYFDNNGELSLPNLLDLLNQAAQIVKRKSAGLSLSKSKNFTLPVDWFYDGNIELPSGDKQEIFIQRNETGKYTIMLPEDY